MPPTQEEIDRGDFLEEVDEETTDLDSEDSEDEEYEEEEKSEDQEEDKEVEDDDESEEEEDAEEDDGEGDTEEDDGSSDEDEEKPSQRVPVARLNRVIKQREREKERVEWLEDQLERLLESQVNTAAAQAPKKDPEPEYNFEEAEGNYTELLIEGETAKAAKLRTEIDKERNKQYQQMFLAVEERLKKAITEETTSTVEDDRFNTIVENFENKYTFLDLESDDYNEEATETVNTLTSGYLAQGLTKTEALKKAVKKVAPMYEKDSQTNENKQKSQKRKKDGRKRNASTVKQTPAKLRSKGTRTVDPDDTDVSKMSERDFGKLTAKEKAVLRGDVVG